ncbi:hypothetical protein [Streptomyces violascens]|uniref:Streptomyces killer toxin-like beta/gamma crystallin domain-containing protein n=1 Tax=Streptomyces violascens TaxID=67381 RepID=A0ABQ3QEW6_9ACTN|nr:hypothetical protein [Streptomyces violascens]GGU46774.1 hypothetical protein GCM10010289_79090 [Streptomyces violascens]GHI35827.1 hypothetical protein Sviol_02350 [Streptomyces violascens]
MKLLKKTAVMAAAAAVLGTVATAAPASASAASTCALIAWNTTTTPQYYPICNLGNHPGSWWATSTVYAGSHTGQIIFNDYGTIHSLPLTPGKNTNTYNNNDELLEVDLWS